MRAWLARGAIPDDERLADDLTHVDYGYNAAQEIQLERKEQMRARLAVPRRRRRAGLHLCRTGRPARAAGASGWGAVWGGGCGGRGRGGV